MCVFLLTFLFSAFFLLSFFQIWEKLFSQFHIYFVAILEYSWNTECPAIYSLKSKRGKFPSVCLWFFCCNFRHGILCRFFVTERLSMNLEFGENKNPQLLLQLKDTSNTHRNRWMYFSPSNQCNLTPWWMVQGEYFWSLWFTVVNGESPENTGCIKMHFWTWLMVYIYGRFCTVHRYVG